TATVSPDASTYFASGGVHTFVFSHVRSCFFFSSRRRHTRSKRDWSSDVCSSDLYSSTSLRPGPPGRRVRRPLRPPGSLPGHLGGDPRTRRRGHRLLARRGGRAHRGGPHPAVGDRGGP